jgi:hypothetical protein
MSRRPPPWRGRWRAGARRALLAPPVALLWLLALAPPASADNCGSLSDCFFTIAAALAVVAAVALIIAGIIAFPAILAALGGFTIGAGGTLTIGGAVAIPAAAATAIAVAEAAAAAAAAATAAGATISMMSRPSGKERGSDIPSWAKGSRPNPGETPRQAAERILGERYGPGNYPKGPGSEFNKIKKFFERLLRLEGNK